MREQTIRAIELTAGLALFVAACVFAMNLVSLLESGFAAAAGSTQDQNAGITTHPAVAERFEQHFSGSQVLFMLRDVEEGRFEASVDGFKYSAGLELEGADLTPIDLNGRYGAVFHRGTGGGVKSILFEKVR